MMPQDALSESVVAPGVDEVGSTGIKIIEPVISEASLRAVTRLDASSSARIAIPVRKSFVRSADPENPPPLASFFKQGGRGAHVDLKVLLAVIWRCSSAPYRTEISARQIATLLDLDDPRGQGARRVNAALDRLEERRLVRLKKRPGQSTVIILLNESGDGTAYDVPSGKVIVRSGKKVNPNDPNLYAKVPVTLWKSGHMQQMSAPALAMLLILLEEQAGGSRSVWFSTESFPERYRISASVRSRGTRELIARQLLYVRKQLVEGNSTTFGRERVRNLYYLTAKATGRPETPDAVIEDLLGKDSEALRSYLSAKGKREAAGAKGVS